LKLSKNPYQIPWFPSRPRTPPTLSHHCITTTTILSLSIFLVLLTNLLHLTLAHISKVDSHGHSFYGPRNLIAIHHANFLSSTPRPDDVAAAATAAGILNMTFSEHLAVRSGLSSWFLPSCGV
jgi:hypothetical protein